jgi:hypothetical protein
MMEDQTQWSKLLDPKSTHKLLYSLKIIQTICNNKKDQKVTQWKFKFIQMGGYQHLINTFIGLEIQSIETSLTLKCIEALIMIIYEFIQFDKNLLSEVMSKKE